MITLESEGINGYSVTPSISSYLAFETWCMTCNRYYSIFLSHLHDINAKLNQLTARVYDNGRNAWQETADVRVIS